jgi:hypothetical protein
MATLVPAMRSAASVTRQLGDVRRDPPRLVAQEVAKPGGDCGP